MAKVKADALAERKRLADAEIARAEAVERAEAVDHDEAIEAANGLNDVLADDHSTSDSSASNASPSRSVLNID